MSRFSWKNEWKLQNLKEESFLVHHVMDKTPKWVSLLESKVPASLQNTMESAFHKAFVTVFEKGLGVIERTYRKGRQIDLFKENKENMDKETFSGRAVKKFERQAKHTVYKNLAITSVEGIGLGLVGMGIPDIFIFVSILLKSIYEIALSYGFSYEADKEKLFILKVIDASLRSGDTLRKKDEGVNKLIERYYGEEMMSGQTGEMDEFVTELQIVRQLDASAEALSHELLYGKFVQGKAVIGVVGGTLDFTCLKKVTDYAVLKYKRRFLLREMPELND